MEEELRQKIKILIIDDDLSIHKLIAAMLRSLDADIIASSCGLDGLAACYEHVPDLVLLDYQLGDTNGIDILKKLKAAPRLCQIPVMMVTADDSHSLLTRCFIAGAEDYIHKPICKAELISRANRLLDHSRLIDELRRLAMHDSLTGLPNRTMLLERLQKCIDHRSLNNDSHFAVLFLDFDRFKQVNDSLGHEAGDELLKSIARRLENNVRRSDLVTIHSDFRMTPTRFGGDEFVVLLEGLVNPGDAGIVGRRLMQVLSEPHHVEKQTIVINASIGLVDDNPKYQTAKQILRDADTAMYHAKLLGRGRMSVFNDAMHEAAIYRMELEQDLREAIRANQFFLHYQPLVNIDNGRIDGVEALIRWRHPAKGNISPAEFIPMAEECDLISEIGDWVFETAVKQLATWRIDLGIDAIPSMSVNLSRQQLVRPGLIEDYARIANENGIETGAIHLEITESVAMTDVKESFAILNQLRQAGFKLDLDDFGTGHSSLSCLQEFRFDVLKIDRSFIQQLEKSVEYDCFVQAITLIASRTGMQVLAEGIETVNQLQILRKLNCHLGQGFYFSRPIDPSDIPHIGSKIMQLFQSVLPNTIPSELDVLTTP